MKEAAIIMAMLAAGCSGPETFPHGRWQIKSAIIERDIGGREVDFAKGRTNEWSSCIGAAEAQNPAERLIPGILSGSCRFAASSFANGRMQAQGECISGAMAPLRVTIDGQFSDSTLSARLVTVEPNAGLVVDQPGMQKVTTRVDVTGERKGPC
ncbi:MAG TPA: DUF3617 family protein [Allosphingosinicella sp.]